MKDASLACVNDRPNLTRRVGRSTARAGSDVLGGKLPHRSELQTRASGRPRCASHAPRAVHKGGADSHRVIAKEDNWKLWFPRLAGEYPE